MQLIVTVGEQVTFNELSEIIQDIHQVFARQAGRSVNVALTLRK